jgi:hypothetical protein
VRGELRLVAALIALALLAGALTGHASARDDRQERIAARHWLLGGLLSAVLAQERTTERLLDRPGVVGTAVSRTADGEPALVILRGSDRVDGLPSEIGGVPTVIRTIGRPRMITPDRAALRQEGDEAGDGESEPAPAPELTEEERRFERPVPIGVSVGNVGECTAGTIGARVTDGRQVYLLSNNHVLARENAAPIGSDVVQPGPADTSCETDPGDVLGGLDRIEHVAVGPDPLDPATMPDPAVPVVPGAVAPAPAENLIDAALALTSPTALGNATPADGYGLPVATTITAEAALGQTVQKYGRTTGLTKGKVVGINGVLEVAYGGGLARFVDQLIVMSDVPFLASGDSGALLVTDPGRRPAGLLFASNSAGNVALANEIDHVLDAFGVTIDGEPPGLEGAWLQAPGLVSAPGR